MRMSEWDLRCMALEQVKAGIAEFARHHPEQDVSAMLRIAEATLHVESPIQEVREKMASIASLLDKN